MQTASNYTRRRPHIKLFAMLLVAAFMLTAVAIAPAGAKKHDQDGHHEHKEHQKHWHEYDRHVYYPPPPVIYAPQPEYYAPPPPPVYYPQAPSINFIIPLPIH
jgi:hypothetical protein